MYLIIDREKGGLKQTNFLAKDIFERAMNDEVEIIEYQPDGFGSDYCLLDLDSGRWEPVFNLDR